MPSSERWIGAAALFGLHDAVESGSSFLRKNRAPHEDRLLLSDDHHDRIVYLFTDSRRFSSRSAKAASGLKDGAGCG
jgi:hypothetical protein